MSWQFIPIDRFSDYSQQWDSILVSCIPVPFLESDFIRPLLKEFGNGQERLAIETQDGLTRAAAVVVPVRQGFWQTFQPSQLPLGTWISKPDVDMVELSRTLVSALPGFTLGIGITQLDPILQPRPADAPGTKTLDYIQTAWVDIEGPYETYWEARGKNLRTNLRKQRAKLETEGTIPVLECITDPKQVAQALKDYGTLESAGWKAQGGTAIHPDNAQGRFYRQMLESFCAKGRGRIYRYYFGDKVVAMDLCIEAGTTLVILKTAYDESFKTISPSSLMRHDQFKQIFDAGRIRRIEFYGKVLEWHTRWTNNARTIYHLTRYRWPVLQTMHSKLRSWRTGRSASTEPTAKASEQPH